MYNSKDEIVDDLSTTSATVEVITWSANTPTLDLTPTGADGDAPTVAELGILCFNQNAQITLLIAEVNELRSAINS